MQVIVIFTIDNQLFINNLIEKFISYLTIA